MNKQFGFTLVEVLVSLVIFALVIVGITSVFIAGGKLILHSRERLTSGELGKLYLDPLQAYVRQDTWDQAGNRLATAFSPFTGASQSINNRTFDETHSVADVASTTLHRVISTINWTEPSS